MTYSNVTLATGHTYQSSDYDSLFHDPYTIGNIDLGSLLTSAIPGGGITLNTNSPYYTNTYTNTAFGSLQAADAKVNISQTGIDMKHDCDIKIGNRSLKDFMEQMEQRLALLQINPKLESEWEELKELGDRYRQLENDIKEKMKTWDILSRNDVAEQKAR